MIIFLRYFKKCKILLITATSRVFTTNWRNQYTNAQPHPSTNHAHTITQRNSKPLAHNRPDTRLKEQTRHGPLKHNRNKLPDFWIYSFFSDVFVFKTWLLDAVPVKMRCSTMRNNSMYLAIRQSAHPLITRLPEIFCRIENTENDTSLRPDSDPKKSWNAIFSQCAWRYIRSFSVGVRGHAHHLTISFVFADEPGGAVTTTVDLLKRGVELNSRKYHNKPSKTPSPPPPQIPGGESGTKGHLL